MYLSHIDIVDFKNLNLSIDAKNGINLLIAPNGWGKTNFLEAIDYLSHLKSFRLLSDEDLVSWNPKGDFSKISAVYENDKKETIEVVLTKTEEALSKKVFVNKQTTNPKKFRTILHTILYSPHNADIVSSSPDIRRREFDRKVAYFDENYEQKLKEYKFLVKSRNKILGRLGSNQAKMNELEYWNERFIETGEFLIKTRMEFLENIEDYVRKHASEMFEAEMNDMKIIYQSKSVEDGKVAMREKVEDNLQKEIDAGMSLYGPHRDDYMFMHQGRLLREFGSRGQQRLAGLIVVFSLFDYTKAVFNAPAILLLDDIMSELDHRHIQNLETKLQSIGTQIFLTTAYKQMVDPDLLERVNLLREE